MADYTVVLLRPASVRELDMLADIYVASRCTVPGEYSLAAAQLAVLFAKQEVIDADWKDRKFFDPPLRKKPVRKNYKLLLVFEGHHDPKYFGFQTGIDRDE